MAHENSKRAAAEKAVEAIQDGMIVGLGTGSTAYWAIQQIGRKVKGGLRIQAAATSVQSERLAVELGIPLIPLADIEELDITIDGADEVDGAWNVIKGGGGALLREKIIAAASRKLIVVVDESKVVRELGRFHLPVEVVPFGWELTRKKLRALGCEPHVRMVEGQPYVTDNGNYIMDCEFQRIALPSECHDAINRIPGVVDNGLFIGMVAGVIVGCSDGTVKELKQG
ncbi:ribose-5-phosphate isomerase RpiA [Paenibacillus sp. GCM10023248]|uniref:ribose-5-phosphate isomerase RpiA n=1 Tax=unclassified Paenibacillus TaxID=185978 RepID=UPI00237819E8|nr:ribose-5-phosphate isomerase RpiA [Paenibacillus sp. MAHUQ-63]MDD9268764.1 ribose-5-phosphate isomerase RpiA [Paenibacillus sp. MAHUQ-63]